MHLGSPSPPLHSNASIHPSIRPSIRASIVASGISTSSHRPIGLPDCTTAGSSSSMQHYSIVSRVRTANASGVLLRESETVSLNVMGAPNPFWRSRAVPCQSNPQTNPGGPNAVGRNANVTCNRTHTTGWTNGRKTKSERIRKCNSRRFCI